MKIMLVAGARPNFMKIASIIDAINKYNNLIENSKLNIQHCLVHTGQHYDDSMSEAFFRDLDLPRPNIHLDVGSASHAAQTAEIMKRFEPILLKEQPDVVMVVGDVNSTIACTLVASKIDYDSSTQHSTLNTQHLRRKPLIAHVESGLRSFDRSMPEEINRILTDQLSDFLFVSEQSGLDNLKNEGFKNFLFEEDILKINDASHLTPYNLPVVAIVGNTMIDTLLKHREKSQDSGILNRLGLKKTEHNNSTNPTNPTNLTNSITPYAVLTLHRPSNVDDKETFQNILEALLEVSKHLPIIFPVHPRTINRIKEFDFEKYFNLFPVNSPINTKHSILDMFHSTLNTQHSPSPQSSALSPKLSCNDSSFFPSTSNLPPPTCGIHCVEPLGYLDFLCLMSNAKLVLTDSGGIQEETTILGIPCVTLRENTERPITITQGTNILAGTNKEKMVECAFLQLNGHKQYKPNKFVPWNAEPISLGPNKPNKPEFWDGHAGERIIRVLIKRVP